MFWSWLARVGLGRHALHPHLPHQTLYSLAVHHESCYVAGSDGVPVFHRSRPPATAVVEALVKRIAVKSERFLARAGHGPDDEPAMDPDDGQELVQAASLAGRVGLGRRAGRRTRRVVLVGGREVRLPARCGVFGGYNLHAGVWVGPQDRVGLERLARYVCRPALAKSRLERRADGQVVLRLKRAWSDGTAAFVFSPAELVSRLASLVPPPRANQVLYHGVLAPNASWRSLVVPKPEPEEGAPALVSAEAVAAPLGRRRTWSTLLLRVFGVDGWCCPHCGERMKLRVPVVGPSSSGRVLRGLARSARGPPSQAQTTA